MITTYINQEWLINLTVFANQNVQSVAKTICERNVFTWNCSTSLFIMTM
jgi:hypothetical protein